MNIASSIHPWLTLALVVCAGRLDAAYTVERVVSGLNQPTYMTQAPGDNNHLYIVERTEPGGSSLGRVLAYNQLTKTSTTFLDLAGTVQADGGLLSMTFHPDYQSNGLFYTVSNVSGVNGLDEWKSVGGVPQVQRRLYEYQNLSNVFHTMNEAFFRPGGSGAELFLTTGDGGTQANEPTFDPSLIEDPTSPYGKVVKIDLTGDFATPAAGPSHPDVDLVALGLRNPYRSSFDRETGDFYIGDVGFNAVEEVNFIPASHFENPAATPIDFGWTSREGTIATIGGSAGGPGSPSDVDPIYEYAHHGGIPLGHTSDFNGASITGGYVYRGPVEELQGRYFLTDFTAQRIYSGEFDTTTPAAGYNGDNFTDVQRHDIEFEELLDDGTVLQYLTSFNEDNFGNLYMVKFGNSFFPPEGQGEIFRIVPLGDDQIELVVDRDTGAVTLQNSATTVLDIQSIALSSAVGAISPSDLTPVTGLRDADGDMSVDHNDAWSISSSTSSLFVEATTGDAGQLAPQSQLVYSPADGWVRSPVEDLAATVLLGDGTIVNAQVSYTGNGGAAFESGDLNFDGVINRADFVALASQLHTDLSGLGPAQAYAAGDLTGDGVSNYDDFAAFKATYISLHGEEAFAGLLASAPEPTTALLTTCGIGGVFAARRRDV
ncbi:PQQ-dependent sugar dehydrogenase [Botrimarina mediterranea]|uniref:PQQ-dependent sugar dehydrogenase n=1 Tax=Botrimarina mediterranea TaxID=2528022 RepID=UPI00118B4789|nr:hypothetical protein K2D_23200 [Planctomycetes bacterium K2D]